MIRDCKIIAIDGAHGTGKTTVVHAVAARLKQEGVHLAVQADVARMSSLVEEVVVHRKGDIDLSTELHILGRQLSGEQELAREHELVVCDKSALSVIAYTRLFLDEAMSDEDRTLFEAFARAVRCYSAGYDQVFLLQDLYPLEQGEDSYRPVDPQQRHRAVNLIEGEWNQIQTAVHAVPEGLDTQRKVDWILSQSEMGNG